MKKIRLQIQAAEMSFRPLAAALLRPHREGEREFSVALLIPSSESWTSVTKDKNPFYLFFNYITAVW